MTEVHVHLGDVPAGSVVHVYVDELGGGTRVQGDEEDGTDEDKAIEDRLSRMEKLPSAAPGLRTFVADLRAMGYTIRMPAGREGYLRVMDPAAPAHGAGYMRSSSVTFTRGEDRDKLIALGGGKAHSHGVRFMIQGNAREAAHLVKR
jgi:hypothetical protein